MALTAGIVGLPNVGKSTLFNAITKAGALAANYPFATIDPNVGIVEVPDHRLNKLTELVEPKKTVPTSFEFTDIAGIVKGASKGEGLGNKFLSHIREVDAICQVVRCFEDENITHVAGGVDPLYDIEVINLELILADLESVEKRIGRVEKQAKQKDKDAMAEFGVLSKVRDILKEEKPARLLELDKEVQKIAKNLHLLTMKPMLYVANVSEDDLLDVDANKHVASVREFAANEGSQVIVVCAKIEEEMASLEDEEKAMFLEELGIDENQEEVLLLKHLVLAHHGKLEYGSPVRPQLLEAEVLHHIDLLDATITMISNALDKTEPGAFSERVFGLDNRSFYKTLSHE